MSKTSDVHDVDPDDLATETRVTATRLTSGLNGLASRLDDTSAQLDVQDLEELRTELDAAHTVLDVVEQETEE